MQRSFMLSVFALAIAHAASALADDEPRLKGTYGFTGTDACLYSPAGFNARLQPIGSNWSSSNSVEGTRTFNGDGTGSVQQGVVSINPPPTPGFLPSASSNVSTFSFTFTVNGNTFSSDTVPGSFVGTVLTGPRAGQTFTLDNQPTTTGLISGNGKTLTIATLSPGVETQTFSNGDVEQRICHRSRVLFKLDKQDKDD